MRVVTQTRRAPTSRGLRLVWLSLALLGVCGPDALSSTVEAVTVTCGGGFSQVSGRTYQTVLYTDIQNCTIISPNCGNIDSEIDWDEGGGWGDNQIDPPTTAYAVWNHTYATGGTFHIKVASDDAVGNGCRVEFEPLYVN